MFYETKLTMFAMFSFCAYTALHEGLVYNNRYQQRQQACKSNQSNYHHHDYFLDTWARRFRKKLLWLLKQHDDFSKTGAEKMSLFKGRWQKSGGAKLETFGPSPHHCLCTWQTEMGEKALTVQKSNIEQKFTVCDCKCHSLEIHQNWSLKVY